MHLNDFGLAKNSNAGNDRISSAASNIKGTEEYLAPEILNAKSSKPTIVKQDVWSIGVMAYELCTFSIPFKCDTSGATIDAIIKDTQLPIEQGYSAGLKDLINHLLTKDPEQRLSIQQLIKEPTIRKAVISLYKEFRGK